MNFSNTFFPLASTLSTLPLHSLQNPLSNALNPNFNFINPLLLSSSTSLNNKRYIHPSAFPALTEPTILASNTKRHKPNGDIQSIVLLSPEQISTQGKGSKLPAQEVITIDEDEDCVILEQPASGSQGKVTSFGSDQIGGLSEFNYAGLLNQVNKRNPDYGANNLLNFNKNLGLGIEAPQQNLFMYEVFKNNYMNTLQQSLMNTQNFPSINQINQTNQMLLQTNFNQQPQIQINNTAAKEAIVVIDDDLIMPEAQMPPVVEKTEKMKRPVISDSDKLNNLLGRRDKVKSINKGLTTTIKASSEKVEQTQHQWENIAETASNPDATQAESDKTDPSSPLSYDKILATIPPLEKRGEAPLKKSRKIKLKWDPSTIERAELEKYLQEVDRITSIENANEEKSLEALKEHKMNVEVTLEKIKRNKAHYKNQLRVHRIDRLRAQYY